MAQINLPKEMLQKEAFKSLPAKEKEEYLSNLLKRILELNTDGVTNSQMREATGLTDSTIWHHLEVLSCTAQCHKTSRGNLNVYHPTEAVDLLKEYTEGKSIYTVSVAKNGDFVFIQEKQEKKTGNYTVCKGISIPFELIGDLIKTLSKVKQSNIDK